MNTIDLTAGCDPGFAQAVEAESGQKITTCYQCGKCTAGCPCGPAYDLQVNQILRGVQLGQRELVLSSSSLWLCVSCSTCSLRCPNNIDVAQVMETLRHMARRAGKKHCAVAAFWDSFLTAVRLFGRSYELGVMAAYMARTGKVWTDVDLVPKVLPRNKLPYLPHAVAGRAQVGRIFKRFERMCAEQEEE